MACWEYRTVLSHWIEIDPGGSPAASILAEAKGFDHGFLPENGVDTFPQYPFPLAVNDPQLQNARGLALAKIVANQGRHFARLELMQIEDAIQWQRYGFVRS